MAMITIPPFRITGRIHLLPQRELREALSELTGAFIPVTDAAYWSDTIGEARTTAPRSSPFNHNRAHILAPHTEVDPWRGLDRSAAAGGPVVADGQHPDRRCRRSPGPRHSSAAGPLGRPPETRPDGSQGGGWG